MGEKLSNPGRSGQRTVEAEERVGTSLLPLSDGGIWLADILMALGNWGKAILQKIGIIYPA
jgi:hypothetical protein